MILAVIVALTQFLLEDTGNGYRLLTGVLIFFTQACIVRVLDYNVCVYRHVKYNSTNT